MVGAEKINMVEFWNSVPNLNELWDFFSYSIIILE